MDRLTYALAAQALEPGDALALRRAAVRPGLAARMQHAQAALGDGEAGFGPWLLPPAGRFMLGELHLDAGPWLGGDRLPVLLDGSLPPASRLAVTVHTRAGARVLSPVSGAWLRLSALRRTAEGAYALDLVLDDVPGLHRVVLEVLAEEGETRLAQAELAVRLGGGGGEDVP